MADRHDLPVDSVVILLRREADDPGLTGTLRMRPPRGRSSLVFRYEMMRLWQRPVEAILSGGVGTLPLAPLCNLSPAALPGVIQRMEARLAHETAPAEAATLWVSTYLLMGLRYPPAVAAQLLQGVRAMKESSTYQAILAEGEAKGHAEGETVGRIEEARKVLLLLGGKQFGASDASTRATIEAADLDRLERWTERLLDVSSWEELLAPA